jgi:DNA-binding transcriptional LysR family regulator
MKSMRQRDDQSLNFYLLRCLVALVEHSHVTRAADSLDMSQPAMSRAMGQLRKLTGDPILVKGESGLIPTAKAQQLRDFAASLLRGVDHLLGDALAFDPVKTARSFRILATDYVECVFLNPMMNRLGHAFPHISASVAHPVNPKLINPMLERGEVDFCIGMLPPSLDSLRHRLLFNDRVSCVASKAHAAVGRRLSASEFAQLDHLVIKPTVLAFGEAVDDGLASRGLARNVRLVSPGYLSVPYVVESSSLVALVPQTLAQRFAARFDLAMLDVDLDMAGYAVYLYWHERTHHHQEHVWFRETALRMAPTLPAAGPR